MHLWLAAFFMLASVALPAFAEDSSRKVPSIVRIPAGQSEMILSAQDQDLRLLYYGRRLLHPEDLLKRQRNPTLLSAFGDSSYPDRSRAAVFAYRIRNFRGERENPGLFLQGLDPDALYRVEEVNTVQGKTHSGLNGQAAYGDTLMRAGLPVHLRGEYDSAVWILTRH